MSRISNYSEGRFGGAALQGNPLVLSLVRPEGAHQREKTMFRVYPE